MGSRRHGIACLLAAVALGLPSAAWGQGAGDDQYQDPFGDEPAQSEDQGDDQESTPEPQDAPESSGDAQPAPAPPAPPADEGRGQLPYTGVETGFVALAGGALLATGLALRRRSSGVALRDRLSEPAPRRR
jgi:LPXTG-motif cell wall-anchored protein